MDLKNLFGYGLTITGSALIPLFLAFLLLDGQYLNHQFLYGLGIIALVLLCLGVFIINKSR